MPDIRRCDCDAGAQFVLDAGGWMEDWAVVEGHIEGMVERSARGPTVIE